MNSSTNEIEANNYERIRLDKLRINKDLKDLDFELQKGAIDIPTYRQKQTLLNKELLQLHVLSIRLHVKDRDASKK